MEAKINVVEILKDKPQGTKLYSILSDGECFLNEASEDSIYIDIDNRKRFWRFTVYGSTHSFPNGCVLLFPSREMRDWEKFSWKRGDVLMAGVDNICIFEKWDNEDYTEFKAIFATPNYSGATFKTEKWSKETNEAVIKQYISNIEKFKGGKLNLATLEIEKQPEFKDGDIVALVVRKCTHIAIFQSRQGAYIGFHAVLCQNDELLLEEPFREDVGDIELRLATDSEKQQLFEALAKEGKAWDAEKKQIVDLKPKCEFKPFDRCIWKIRNCEGSIWQASFVSYVDKYGATPMGMSIDEDLVNLIILPYNNQTKLLVGTTDEWKGGEQ